MRASSIDNRRIPLFEGIERRDFDALLGCLKANTRRYSPGEFILLDQDAVRQVGVVLRGTVHLLKEDHAGHRTLLTWLEEDDVFGEPYITRPDPMSDVSLYAANEVEVLYVCLEHLLQPCKNNCAFHRTLTANAFRLLGEEYRLLLEKIEVCTQSSLREKILAYLTMLSRRQGQKYIISPLSRTEMAAYLQSNRSAMTRELSLMKRDGLIDFDGSTFVLLK